MNVEVLIEELALDGDVGADRENLLNATSREVEAWIAKTASSRRFAHDGDTLQTECCYFERDRGAILKTVRGAISRALHRGKAYV